jgi:hypothetical protein
MDTEYNLDINPKTDTLLIYPDITYLFENNTLRLAFNQYETRANHFKKLYWRNTKTGVILIGSSVLCAIYFWVFTDQNDELRRWSSYIGCLGLIGIGIELYVIFGKLKHKWLLNRFLAERLRSYVAQMYAVGAASRSSKHLKKLIDSHCQACMNEIHAELNKGKAAFNSFIPNEGIALPIPIEKPSSKIFEQCRQAYQFFRVDFQKDFVVSEISQINDKGRVDNTVSDLSFLFGAVFATLGLIVLPIDVGEYKDFISRILIASGTAMFFVSSILSLIGSGNTPQTHSGRYQNYLEHINSLKLPIDDSPSEFVLRIRQMEMEALRELEAFCLQIESVSIRI